MIVPGKPKEGPAAAGMIRVEPGAAGAAKGQKKAVSVEKYWMDFYRLHDESAADLKEKITLLNLNKPPKTKDVQAILVGYLTFHSKSAEPWMYEALALAIQMNGGSNKDVKDALGYAADLAEKERNPNHLVSVADLLFLHGFYDRVGDLLDAAAEKVPHRGEPLVMSINLAQKTRDPKRMASAIEGLLSLGWPGDDERIRSDARKQAEILAKTLREEGRNAEADMLLSRLPEAEARDLFVRLTWTGDAGLDLVVKEPLGATARVLTPRTVFGGAIVKDGYGSHPEEVYVCPRGFDGKYELNIESTYNNPEKPALRATLEIITHEGTPQEKTETRTVSLGKTVPPIIIELKGGRRKSVLPFVSPSALSAELFQAGRKQLKPKTTKKAAKPQEKTTKGAADPAQPALDALKVRPR